MSLFKQVAKVKAAQQRMTDARHALAEPASALLAKGHQHPLTTVGISAGAGFVLGRLNVHPLRIPGLGSMLSGGFADIVAQGVHLVAELGEGAANSTGG